ncbi:MAG: protein-L-isoaspartate(D-aspartate) O-methyltransferase [Piscinibacter sp.]|uniref:protein-L-isoaspartate(D-aspartate) O-methyltransferase n=1 Tax=Piscinibacter sp. TaxID=1903157 RepID=UPI001B507FF2|nr:protein-L-isoaspartate(D-aspartate) O-methyltransferase [Piscinibacter sp.]MBP5990935.1 protein-L-isoaspartate(D-aspartate) O-methyltransferase [Piscinibacter sp.]MBP6028427.1 protein-L-isoaspartate(D-aspartate) O-methyltransferase [Piscinibacter sp.]
MNRHAEEFARRRDAMVREQIEARGVHDARVLQAMRELPRERFVRPGWEAEAYDDNPLPIAAGQTISQPYIVAFMSEALQLRGGERVLEIGTGSGYAAAVLGRLAKEVHTVERHAVLAEGAAAALAALGVDNVQVHTADGTLGWPAAAPYDAIVVTAAGPEVPVALLAQLAVGGRLVMPVGEREGAQWLLRLTRVNEHETRREELMGVRFVPLTGAQGWPG